MAMGKDSKCAHPVCSCTVSSGKYCSPQCEAMEKTPDVDCKCNHPGCKGKASH
jgi:metallothionein